MVRLGPFACGPFEARSRHLATTVDRCEYADRYFAAMSRRGNAKNDLCVSTDGAQGAALSHCVRSMVVTDLGSFRQKYATVKQLNESHSVFIIHPIKSRGAESDANKQRRLIGEWQHIWSYLLRAPHKQVPVYESRITFGNDTRPQVERLPMPKPAHSTSPARGASRESKPLPGVHRVRERKEARVGVDRHASSAAAAPA
jgi:hypothetical protein